MELFKSKKRLLWLIISAVFFFQAYKIRKLLREWNRKKKILLQLPTAIRPESKKNSLDFFGMIMRNSPVDKFSFEAFSKYFVAGAMSAFDENEGVFANWSMNPNVVPMPVCDVYILDGDLARTLLSTKMLPKLKKGRAYQISDQLIGQSVLSTSGNAWHRQRIVIERGFTESLIRKQFNMVVQTAEDLVGRITFLNEVHTDKENGDGVEIDVIEEMLKTTMDVLGRVAFSYDIGSLQCTDTKDAPLYDAFDNILATLHCRIYSIFKHLTRSFLPSDENLKFNNSLKKLNTVILDIVTKRKAKGVRSDEEPRDLLDILLQGTEDAKGKRIELTDTQILDNMRTILFAGHDTTAAALTWGFYLLAKHSEYQNKILDESEATQELSVERLEQSELLNAVVLEILRLYPSAAFTRTAVEDIKLGKYLIPKDIDILIAPYFIQRRNKKIEKPNEFMPERWINDNKKSEKIGLQATLAKATLSDDYLPFSLGKRNCVGRKLALLEIRVIILQVLKEFEVCLPDKMTDDFQETPYLGLTLFPKDVYLKFKPRSSRT